MSYQKAEQILPEEVIKIIQQYVDGEMLYIPRKESTRKTWGSTTGIKESLMERNTKIYQDYLNGDTSKSLADKYYLSIKSIQRITSQMNKISV